MVTVSAGARLHLGLVDMGNATARAFGGIGCMLEHPRVVVDAEVARRTLVTWDDLDADFTASETLNFENEIIDQFIRRHRLAPTAINIRGRLPAHIGLGSRTATILAALVASAIANGMDGDALPVNELQMASRRGRTSGIGVHGFFTGGWIVDAGQPAGTPLVPSSAQSADNPSLLIQRVHSPDWSVALFHIDGTELSGHTEIDFFQRNTPVDPYEVLQSVALLYHGMLPALMTRDLAVFGSSLSKFQEIGFKALEIKAQPPVVRHLISALKEVSPCVGMSSVGPLVFAIGGASDDLESIAARFRCGVSFSPISNNGWRLIHG